MYSFCYPCDKMYRIFASLHASRFRSELNSFHSSQVCESLLPSSGVINPTVVSKNKLEPVKLVFHYFSNSFFYQKLLTVICASLRSIDLFSFFYLD